MTLLFDFKVALIVWIHSMTSTHCNGLYVSQSRYSPINGLLCLNPAYVASHSQEKAVPGCALLCSLDQRCQAFTINDGPCQLFVFDKCSKSVRDCSCTRRGQVFVKQQPGLEPGALCPDYGDDLCGVKYKLYNGSGFWQLSRQKCETQSGLVIMADVFDVAEMKHVDGLYHKYSLDQTFWLGGFQPPGSIEPSGGWYWVGCNITLDSGLWGIGEPDNSAGGLENAVGRSAAHTYLADLASNDLNVNRSLCECVSPF